MNPFKLNLFILAVVIIVVTVFIASAEQNIVQQDKIKKNIVSNEPKINQEISKISIELQTTIKTSPYGLIPIIISLKEQPIHEISESIRVKKEMEIQDIQKKVKTIFMNAKGRSTALRIFERILFRLSCFFVNGVLRYPLSMIPQRIPCLCKSFFLCLLA